MSNRPLVDPDAAAEVGRRMARRFDGAAEQLAAAVRNAASALAAISQQVGAPDARSDRPLRDHALEVKQRRQTGPPPPRLDGRHAR